MPSRSTLKFFFVFFIGLVFLTPHAASAQAAGATVRGLIADPDAAVIPGATVTLTPASGNALIATSGSDGTYILRGAPAGTYSVTVTIADFESFVKQGKRVGADQTLQLNGKLPIQPHQQ